MLARSRVLAVARAAPARWYRRDKKAPEVPGAPPPALAARAGRLVDVVLLSDVREYGERGAVMRLDSKLVRDKLYPQGVVAYATDANIIRYAEPFFPAEVQPGGADAIADNSPIRAPPRSVLLERRLRAEARAAARDAGSGSA